MFISLLEALAAFGRHLVTSIVCIPKATSDVEVAEKGKGILRDTY